MNSRAERQNEKPAHGKCTSAEIFLNNFRWFRLRRDTYWARSSDARVVKLRSVRDTTIDKLNTLAKSDGTGAQKAFLDAMALSQTQVRKLADQLSTTLSSITSDNVQGQALAAAALFAANVTPVVTVRIAFGGDNH